MSGALFLLTFVLTANAFVIEEIVPRRKVVAQIGEELNLVCRTRGCASPTFVWSTLLDNPLGGTVRHEGNSSILSMKVGFVNENDYRCTAFCGEEKKQRIAKIEIYSFPSDPVLEISSPLELGKPATITCTFPNVYPSDRLEISLKKEGKSLGLKEFSQDPFTKSLQTKSMTFTFIPAEEDIGKTITCVAELLIEKAKQRETTQRLSVTYAPRSLNFAMLPSAAVQEGESVALQCSANSSPTARFVIKKKLAEKDEVLESQNGSLHILKVTPDDAGEYECEAENGVGNVKATATLSVTYAPRSLNIAMLPSAAVQEGESVTLQCSANSSPTARFVIKKKLAEKDEVLESQNGSLHILKVTPDDAGEYECEAENGVGNVKATATLSVTYAPRSLNFAMLPSAAVQEGESVTLQCSANSSPTARFVIKKKLAEKDEVLESQNGSLHILKVTPDDAGEYECEAENGVGNVKATATLSVTSQPRNTTIITNPSNTVKEGEAVTMICSSYGNPLPSISWKKQLANGTSRLIKEGATFTLKDVRADDEGHYECEAVNSAGKETNAVELIVQVLSPTTPALTDQPETTTELVDFTTEGTSYTTEPQEVNDKETHTEDERLPFTKTATFTAPKNDIVTSPEKTFDVIDPTEDFKVVIARIEEPEYMIPMIIVASTLATAAGPITAALIYACRRSKVNGSYSPVASEV